ncbi:hypothetical protein J4218_03435 [Candidatus Pacearchaeota archaeon]|nr:hypothetical protein [Candidatus Pacearchaeota archaeon]
MDECCTPKCKAVKFLVLGLILILVTLYTPWNIWVVLGVLLIIKAIIMFFMPNCACHGKNQEKPARKR